MNQHATLFVTPLMLLLAVGCSSGSRLPSAAEQALQGSADFELLSLEPLEEKTDGSGFHGWKILGTTPIKDSGTRAKLVSALKAGVADYDGGVAACFIPRHGIRVAHDGKTHEFVICFQCAQVQWYIDGQRVRGFPISGSPQLVFDEILEDANIPLAERPQG